MIRIFTGFFLALISHLAFAQNSPGGRLTLDSANCVMSADQISKQILYYSPCGGNTVPVVTSSGTVQWFTFNSGHTDSVGQSLNLAGSSNWPANTAHDVYEAYNGGAPVLCTVQWTNGNTTYVADQTYDGIAVNSVAMPSCRTGATTTISCPQYQCTHLGSIYIDPVAGQLTAHFSYGQNRRFAVWNRYNQHTILLKAGNPTNEWNPQNTSSAWEAVLGDSGNSLTFFSGRSVAVKLEYREIAWLQAYAGCEDSKIPVLPRLN